MIEIAGRKIGPEYPPYFIADIGANHDGTLYRAHKLIRLAADAGADAVKFQNFSAPSIVSRRGFKELGKIGHQADWETDVYSAYEAASLPLNWTSSLQAECMAAGVAYLTTPYDLEAVDAIDPYVPAWKIGSGDVTYHELIRRVASKGKPILLATGASSGEDVSRAWNALPDREARGRVVLMHCNSDYRGDPQAIRYSNLRALSTSAAYFHQPVGLSDHTPGHLTVCAAVALGACVIEKHFTDDCTRKGPDHAFAMGPDAWRTMIRTARQTWEALGDGIKRVEENEREAVIVQRRALYYYEHMLEGDIIQEADLLPLRPCPADGIPPYEASNIIGKRMKREIQGDTLVRMEDFE